MIVQACQHSKPQKHGKTSQGHQRYKCSLCGKTWTDSGLKPVGNMRTSLKDASTVLGMLLEGMSIRAVERLTGLHRDTIESLILTVGENCQRLMDSIEGVEAKDVEVDETWSFIGLKEKRRAIRGYSAEEFGDSWTWIAIEANTKLVLAHRVGGRDADTCWAF